MHMLKILNNNRGMALLMTVLIISLIFVMTMRFNSSVRSSITSASNLQDSVALDAMAGSVFNAARAILSADAEESDFDSLHEDWANMAVASGYLSMFFEEDDERIEQIHDDYKAGKLLTGELKAMLIEKITKFLTEHQKKLKAADKELHKFI